MMLQKSVYHPNLRTPFFPTHICYGHSVILSHSMRGSRTGSDRHCFSHCMNPQLRTLLPYGNINLQAETCQNKPTPLESQRQQANTQDAMVNSDSRIQWKRMQAFYRQNQLWPLMTHQHFTRMDDSSPFDRTMCHVLSADTRLPTYSWQESSESTVRPPRISNAMWNQRQDSIVSQLLNGDVPCGHNG